METGNLLRCWTLGDGYYLRDWMLLGAEVGRWEAFKSNANRARRTPVVSVMVENLGAVTAKVKNVTIKRHIKDSIHEPTNGRGSITLEDVAGTLIRNGRSIIRRNDKIKIWTGFGRDGFIDGDMVPRFTGVVLEPAVNTQTSEIQIGVQDYGYLMKRNLTSGDFSDYNTPKLLVNELLNRLYLDDATWENESGLPTTYILGNTTLTRRNFWKILHGALLGIGYIAFFDGNGDLQCKRRDTSSESEEVFRDTEIIGLKHVRIAEFINEKSMSLNAAAPVNWSATAGDDLRWGQARYTNKDEISQALYGASVPSVKVQSDVSADYEEDEMIAGWDNILPFVRDTVKQYKYPRHIYELQCAARPYLEIMDKVRIDSDIQNVHGQMTIIGFDERASGTSYSQALTLLTHRELF